MLAFSILKMSKSKHGEDYFQECFHALSQRTNKALWKKKGAGCIFIPLCNYMSKSALCFLARCIFIRSTCHSSQSLDKVRGFFTFRRGMGGTWENWKVSCHTGVQKFKNEDIFHCVVYFSVWEPACIWVFFFQLF